MVPVCSMFWPPISITGSISVSECFGFPAQETINASDVDKLNQCGSIKLEENENCYEFTVERKAKPERDYDGGGGQSFNSGHIVEFFY